MFLKVMVTAERTLCAGFVSYSQTTDDEGNGNTQQMIG